MPKIAEKSKKSKKIKKMQKNVNFLLTFDFLFGILLMHSEKEVQMIFEN